MSHYVYTEAWTPFVWGKLDTAMQPDDVKDKYSAAVF